MEDSEVEQSVGVRIALLQVFRGETEIERKIFAIKEKISIGRNPYTDISLEDSTVPRLHAEIQREAHELVLYNRSTNGTTVNGKPVTRQILSDRDVISIGNCNVIVEIHPDSKSSRYDEARAEGLAIDDDQTISCVSKDGRASTT